MDCASSCKHFFLPLSVVVNNEQAVLPARKNLSFRFPRRVRGATPRRGRSPDLLITNCTAINRLMVPLSPRSRSLARCIYESIQNIALLNHLSPPPRPYPRERGPLTQRTRRVCTAINAPSNAILTAIIFFVTRYNRTATEINISCGRAFDQERGEGVGGEFAFNFSTPSA